MAQRLKRLSPMLETWVQSLGWKDPLEKEMATHSSILAWRIPWTEEPTGGLQSTGLQNQTRLSDFTSPHLSHLVLDQLICKQLPALTVQSVGIWNVCFLNGSLYIMVKLHTS